MMHSIKCQSPLKHDLKLGVEKSSSEKTIEDCGSFSNLMEKCTSSSTQLPSHSSQLTERASNFKSKLAYKVGNQTKLKKSFKRKKESTSLLGIKRLKSDYKNPKISRFESKSKNESKSIYYKDNASYVCKFCCRRFSSVEQLKEHTLIHGNKSSYICHICNHEAACFSALMTHVVKHSRKSDKVENLNIDSINVSTSEKTNSYQCNQCKLSFSTPQKLSSHNCPSISFEKSEYMCAYCGQISTSVEDYRSHVQSHSVTPFMCVHCKLKLPTKKHLDRHNEICKKKPKPKFKCEKCSFPCKGKRELNHHIKICESNKKLPIFDCSSCKSTFSVKSDLDYHISNCKAALSSQNKNFQSNIQKLKRVRKVSYICDLCGKAFTTKVSHEKHKEQCAKLDLAKISEIHFELCPTCGIQIDSLLLEEHIESYHNSFPTEENVMKPSQQSDVEMSPSKYSGNDMSPSRNSGGEESPNARRSARLVRRKVVFSSEEDTKVKENKPKQIKKFKVINKFQSRKGRQSKLGKENFMCFECNLTFCSKSTLLRHKRMHSGNPWFSCKYCGKYFFRKDVFNRHEMNVHNRGNKDIFCCYYCKLFFNAAILLKEHVATAHKENLLQSKSNNFDEMDQQIQVKQEPDMHVPRSDEDLFKGADGQCASELSFSKMFNCPSYNKKCGICSQTFVTVTEIEKHLLTHPVPNDNESSNKDISSSPDKNLNTVFSDKCETDKVNSESCDGVANSTKSNLKENAKLGTNEVAVEKTLEVTSSNIETEKYLCKLCFKAFTDKTEFLKHKSEKHVIIDWYQCLVCSACGSKQDMMEHMFTHMFQVGTFVVANNDFNNVFSCLQQSEIDIQNQREKTNTSEINLNDSECSNIEVEDSFMELPKLTYHGNLNLETENNSMTENHSDVVKEPDICLETNEENAVKKISIDNTNKVECLKESVSIKSSDKDSSSKNKLVRDISIASISNAVHGHSNETPNDKDPFQELRRILKADNIPLKEVSMSSDISSKSDVYNKTFNEEENSSDAQNYSQLRYLLEKNDKSKNWEKLNPVDQFVECTKEHESVNKESTENSDAVNSMRNLIQDLKSLNKLVSENVSNSNTIDEVNFNNLNEADKESVQKSSKAHTTSVKNVNEIDKTNIKKLNEAANINVEKLNETNKVENRNEINKFRLKHNDKLDKNILSQINETSKISCKSSNETNKFRFKNNIESGEMIFSNINEADKLSFGLNNEDDKLCFKTMTEVDKGNPLNSNQIYNTCLKFDVNQSRGEFSERSSPALFQQNTSEFQKNDKLNNLFQSTNPSSTILDFSDLLKISDNTNLNESSIFEISSQNNELCDISTNFACSSSSSFSHKSPVDLTYSAAGTVDVSFSKEGFNCYKCSTKFKSYPDFVEHQCTKPASLFDQISTTPKVKSMPDFPRVTPLDKSSDLVKKRLTALESSKHRSTAIFMCCVCSKIVNTSSILEAHYRAEHSGYSNNSFPNNKCIQCCQILYGIADFMKHSLNCLKSNSSTNLKESARNQGLLQSLLLKPGSQAQETCLANSNASQNKDMASFTYESILNLSRNSFNS